MARAARTSSKSKPSLPSNIFVLDNGGFSIKAGFAPESLSADPDILKRCHTIPNSLVRTKDKRVYVASQQESIQTWTEATFRRPVERGQLVSWEAQKSIWDQSFFDSETAHRDLLIKEPEETTLILTEAPNSMQALQKNADEVIMEEWGFGGYVRVLGPSLNAYNDLQTLFEPPEAVQAPSVPPRPQECLLVIDSGYSHTIITPIFNGIPIQSAIRRIDLGGKHLTNLLKEIVSVRYFDLHQDTRVVNDIKEEVCFVSLDFKGDMERSWKGNKRKQRREAKDNRSPDPKLENPDDPMDLDHPTTSLQALSPAPASRSGPLIDCILPDGFHIKRGFSRPHDPTARRGKTQPLEAYEDGEVKMTLGSERFTVPEILFTPSDVGSRQPGIADTVIQSISVLPQALQVAFLANVLVVGGCAKLPGLVDRVQRELRMLAPAEYLVRVRAMEDPITSTWLGGARMANNKETIARIGVSKAEYAEFGSGLIGRKLSTAGTCS